jgi:hypothetical protein
LYPLFYQGKLNRINERALSLIQERAAARGANAVVGLRVDHDEISGGGKSMLMVTAMGTAVTCQELKTEISNIGENPKAITAEELSIMMRRQKLAAEAAENRLDDSEDTWQFIIENQVREVAVNVLSKIPNLPEPNLYRVRQYFSALAPEVAKPFLYEALVGDWQLYPFALDLIKRNGLFDSVWIRQLMKSPDERTKRLALQAVDADQMYYEKATIDEFEALKADIQTSFTRAKVVIKEKGFLSSSKEVWECSCGRQVELDKACGHCKTTFTDLPD